MRNHDYNLELYQINKTKDFPTCGLQISEKDMWEPKF